MADLTKRVEKLQAMARQTASPNEALNAIEILNTMVEAGLCVLKDDVYVYVGRSNRRLVGAPPRQASKSSKVWMNFIRYSEPEIRMGQPPIPGVARVATEPDPDDKYRYRRA